MSGRVIGAIAANTFREAVRMRLFLLLAVAGIASLAGALFFREFNLGSSELRFIADFGFGAMSLFGSIVAVVATVQLVYGEIENRTILPILSKPISRGAFLAGKLAGSWLTICSFILILALAIVFALWLRTYQIESGSGEGIPAADQVHLGRLFLYAGMQCLRLMLLSSVTTFFCAYASSSMFAVFMGFFAWVIGQLRNAALDTWSGQGMFSKIATWFLEVTVPDFRRFDQGELVFGEQGYSAGLLAGLAVYAVLYSLLYGSLAAWILKKREL